MSCKEKKNKMLGERAFNSRGNRREHNVLLEVRRNDLLPPVCRIVLVLAYEVDDGIGLEPCPAYGARSVVDSAGDNGNLTLAHHTSYPLLSIPQLLINALLDSFSLCTYANTYPDPEPVPSESTSTSRMRIARARKTSRP